MSSADLEFEGQVLSPTDGNDSICGTDGDDNISGLGGMDTIRGLDGNDRILGGNEQFDPDDDADLLFGGAGLDSILGNGGDDTIYGGGEASDPTFDPDDSADEIFGGRGNDLIYGNGGDDAILFDELLINAGVLVNDVSIIKTEPTETFVYHHIELENHTLLVVEGTYAESYFPNRDDRNDYDNCAESEKLYPYGSNLILFPMDYPRVSAKYKVPRYINQKLLTIAQNSFEAEVPSIA